MLEMNTKAKANEKKQRINFSAAIMRCLFLLPVLGMLFLCTVPVICAAGGVPSLHEEDKAVLVETDEPGFVGPQMMKAASVDFAAKGASFYG